MRRFELLLRTTDVRNWRGSTMVLLLVRVMSPPFAVVGLQLVTVKAMHGAAAPVMARTTTSAQVRTLQGLRCVEGMVPGLFDGIRQVRCCGLASTHVASAAKLLIK